MSHLQLLKEAEKLPLEVQQQVNDYIQFLLDKYVRAPAKALESEEEWFWGLIELLDLYGESDDVILEPLVSKLCCLSDEKIIFFNDILSKKLYDLDGPQYYKIAGSGSDSFLYTRAYVVSMGQSFYNNVLNNPNKFPSNQESFEILLNAASRAYERKNNTEFEHLPAFIYETMWNKEQWGEEAIVING